MQLNQYFNDEEIIEITEGITAEYMGAHFCRKKKMMLCFIPILVLTFLLTFYLYYVVGMANSGIGSIMYASIISLIIPLSPLSLEKKIKRKIINEVEKNMNAPVILSSDSLYILEKEYSSLPWALLPQAVMVLCIVIMLLQEKHILKKENKNRKI